LEQENKTIIVTGNPRSGTTVVVKLLKALDIAIIGNHGTSHDMWAPKGYEESQEAVDINREIFEATEKSSFYQQIYIEQSEINTKVFGASKIRLVFIT